MKKCANRLIKNLLLFSAIGVAVVLFTSCDDEIRVDLPGHWVISDVSMNPLMTLDFYDDNTVEVRNATYEDTPEFAENDTWDYDFYYNGRDTILRLSSSSTYDYYDDDYYYDADEEEFVYHRTSTTTISLTSREDLAHYTRTYKFIRR